MANKKNQIGFDSSLTAEQIAEFNGVLGGCQMSARGFFYALIPLLESAPSYGFLEMDAEMLSHHFRLSPHHTRRYLFELKRKKVLRLTKDGALMCPVLIRQHYRIGGTI
jgi:hypothetical protein